MAQALCNIIRAVSIIKYFKLSFDTAFIYSTKISKITYLDYDKSLLLDTH